MLKFSLFVSLFILINIPIYATLKNTTCKKCHPLIYREYQHSMHAKASIFRDPIHKAVWDRHPAKAKDNYVCAKCHTPSDHNLISHSHKLIENEIQKTEPIACQTCHTIERIEEHPKANQNIFTHKNKYFFSANQKKKGTKIVFKEERHLLGMIKTKIGSPFHDIDYSNEIFYTGDLCIGCHSHKQNAKGFSVCDMEIKQGDSNKTCISCHMPQIKGSLANQKQSLTHAYHGHNIHNATPRTLSKYIHLNLEQTDRGFTVTIKNEATHTLFAQPLRLNQLKVSLEREGKTIPLQTESFLKIIGKEGKPSMPWLANEVLKDTLIKALETRKIHYDTILQKGDIILLEFGYYIVNPKIAKKLGISDKKATKFILLTKKRISI